MTKQLMIATPAYSGKVDVPYAISLTQTTMLLAQEKIDLALHIVPSGSLLAFERNNLLQRFYESGCSHLLCIDSDLGWPAEAVIALMNANKDIVGGVYPARGPEKNQYMFKPAWQENGSLFVEGHLIKVTQIPAGFMMITREALEKMHKTYPELHYATKDARGPKEEGYALFNTEMINGEFWGEDFVFCKRAVDAGIELWVDPQIQFNHAGRVGCVMECITNDPSKASPQHIPREVIEV